MYQNMEDSRARFFALADKYIYRPDTSKNGTVSAKPPGILLHHKHQRASSKGERHVLDYLREQGLTFDREKEFPGLSDVRPLRFDFYLPEVGLLVEVDGSQHYQGSIFHHTREEWLKQIRHDNMKNGYCQEKGIHLLRIPCTCTRPEVFFLLNRSLEDIQVHHRKVYEVDVYFQKKAGVFYYKPS